MNELCKRRFCGNSIMLQRRMVGQIVGPDPGNVTNPWRFKPLWRAAGH